MQCPNCQVSFHNREDEWESAGIQDGRIDELAWACFLTLCPKCQQLNILLQSRSAIDDEVFWEDVIYPASTTAVSVGPGVPDNLRNYYLEAAKVLEVSARASAVLSRRILQAILLEQGYTARVLGQQIDAVLNETNPDRILPLAIRRTVDAVRKFGNFSAHPVADLETQQSIEVEPAEAEWCLEIVSALFEHYYVRPTVDQQRLAALNAKLKQAGDTPLK